ncbi:MAG TPA: GerMN domain-containing protein [Methylomirabilota bacterium]|nr:GerMN domain-containing protein [Methylomirabilota bacterium]
MRARALLGAALLATGCSGADGGGQGLVRLASPAPDDTVTSPLRLTGEARGSWYFEGRFPVRLLDAEGRELAAAPARARGEWMTEEFVPFEAVLEFASPSPGTRGTLVLEKDNPSGLAAHADAVRVPIRFGGAAGGSPVGRTTTVQVYFSNPGLAPEPNIDCGVVFPVPRTVPWTPAPARAALEALLAGPDEAERARGYATSINPGVTIRSLVVEDGVATADFSLELERTGGSCLVTAIRAQLERTLLQFPAVRSVRISIAGRTEDILQP